MRELDKINIDSLTQFMHRWYGPPTAPIDVPNAPDVPAVLRAWHELRSQHSLPLRRSNELIPLDEIEVEDGMAVFWVENQAVMEWAYRVGEDDPAVYERINDDGEPWRPVGVRLSTYRVFAEVIDVIFEPRFGALNLSASSQDVDQVVAGLTRPLDPMWSELQPTDACRFYTGPGMLAAVMDNADSDTHALYVAIRDHDQLAMLDDLPWDWHSDDD